MKKTIKESGYSMIEMMMYITLIALSIHYSVPQFKEIFQKIRAQSVMKKVIQAKYTVYEHSLIYNELPSDLYLDHLKDDNIEDIRWDGQELFISWNISSEEQVQATLTPDLLNNDLKWSCRLEGAPYLTSFFCHAVS